MTIDTKKYLNWLYILFPAIMVISLFRFLGYKHAIIELLIRIVFLLYVIYSFKTTKKSIVCQLLIVYIIYNILSVFAFQLADVDFDAYLYDLQSFLLPMLAFFLGANNKDVSFRFYDSLLHGVLFCLIVGLFFYFLLPSWYSLKLIEIHNSTGYLEEISTIGDTSGFLQYARFSSFIGDSYVIQYLGISAASYLFFRINKVYSINVKLNFFYFFSVLIIIISIILSLQRSAWAYLVIIILFYLLIGLNHKYSLQWKYAIIFLVLISLITSIVSFSSDRSGQILSQLTDRLSDFSFSKALSGRSGQYNSLWSNWNHYIFGHGMGSGGAIARISGKPGASDAGYMKILYENGMVGSSIFLMIVVSTILRMLKYRRYYYIEIHIVLFFLVAMIGSNSLCISFFYSIPFWFAIGRIWNHNYLFSLITSAKLNYGRF